MWLDVVYNALKVGKSSFNQATVMRPLCQDCCQVFKHTVIKLKVKYSLQFVCVCMYAHVLQYAGKCSSSCCTVMWVMLKVGCWMRFLQSRLGCGSVVLSEEAIWTCGPQHLSLHLPQVLFSLFSFFGSWSYNPSASKCTRWGTFADGKSRVSRKVLHTNEKTFLALTLPYA